MAEQVAKRELIIPIRTILIVSAAIGVLGAFVAIGDTFLIVFVGIFLGLVFEFPVRFVIRKTGWSRGLAATVTVLGTALGVVVIGLIFLVPMVGSVRDFLHSLPQTIDQLRSSDELSWLGDTGIGKNLHDGFIHRVDRKHQFLVHQILQDLHRLLSQYLRALLILSWVAFAFYAVFLSLTGAPYAVLLAGVAGVLEFVPAVGPFIAMVIIGAVGLFSGYTHWFLLLIFLVVYRVGQDYILQPLLLSSGMRIHPLLIIFGILAGGELGGVPGIFFSIPLIAALRLIFLRLWKQELLDRIDAT